MKSFCPLCGAKLNLAQERSEQLCPGCQRIQYNNPSPVAVCLIPSAASARGERPPELLAGLRAHAPGLGKWGLPAGHVSALEDFQTAARREAVEETGILCLGSAEILPRDSFCAPSNQILVFHLFPALEDEALASFAPNPEVAQLAWRAPAEEWAFQSHGQMGQKHWDAILAFARSQPFLGAKGMR